MHAPVSSAPPSLLWAKSARGALIAALLGLLGAWPGLFSLPPLDRDESRFAQASVQMLETGDFVRIRFQESARNKKPVGIHWLQAASAAVFAAPPERAIWAYRLPSLLAAALAAAFTFLGAERLFGRRAALIGAGLFALSVSLSTEGMIAKTDAALTASAAGLFAALAYLRTRPGEASGRGPAMAFWAAIGVGVLLKGPIVPMIALFTIAALGAFERRWAFARPLTKPLGPLLAVAIAAPWLTAIAIATKGQFFTEALSGDLAPKLAGGAESHGAPPGLHLALLPLLAFPMSLGLIPAARAALAAVRAPREAPAHAATRLCLAFLIPAWLAFEFSPTKLPHYVLPLYPALAALCGVGVERLAAARRTGALRLAAIALYLTAAVALAAVCAYASTYLPGDAAGGARRAAQTALTLLPAVAAATLALLLLQRPLALAGAAGALAFVLLFTARERIAPEALGLQPSALAAAALEREGLAPPPQGGPPRLLSVGFAEPSLVFLTRTDTLTVTAEAAAAAAAVGDSALVAERERARFEAALRARGLAFEPAGAAIEALNYSKGDPVTLQPGRILAAPR